MAGDGVAGVDDGDSIDVRAARYRWRWSRVTDVFSVEDRAGHLIAVGPLQPVVPVLDESGSSVCSTGAVAAASLTGDRLRVEYAQVNGSARITVALHFEAQHFWIEPVAYSSATGQQVVSLQHFALAGVTPVPALRISYLVQPGLSMSSGLSPVLPSEIGLDLTSWLGRGSMGPDSEVSQQWGLPVHYFCGLTTFGGHNARSSLTSGRSDAFCCGLAELPNSDVLLHLKDAAVSLTFNVRADLWKHLDEGADLALGARLLWAFGPDYRDAIRAYYRAVVDAGLAMVPAHSGYKLETLSASQFNTWGAQCAAEKVAGRFDESVLDGIYDGMRASGMRPGVFVIDDKWEGSYGVLRHDAQRFPHFEQFLDRVRADGHRVGLWAAFLRTNDPASVGLTPRHLMCDAAGVPIEKNNDFAREPYYLLDPSHPEVATVLTEQIRHFVRRYDPDLVKFDFGYELPSLSTARPADARYSGELLLGRALEVIVCALRAANPDIAVMYYSLSPLVLDFVDQHCHDDMYLCVDEYELENNRRLFFSSLLAELGVSVYGSGGYDTKSMPDIWFDSAVAGPIGSLNAFAGDEHDATMDAELIALYNGLSAIGGRVGPCTVKPLTPVSVGSTYGARSRSWLRYEHGRLTSAAIRAADANRLPADCGLLSDMPVVVTSLTAQDVASSRRIGVVPFGVGTVHIERDDCSTGYLVNHRLGAQPETEQLERRGTGIAISAAPRRAEQAPLEWIEVVFE